MKQNKQEKLKQYIEETLEQKKSPRVKKRYIIAATLLLHLILFLTVFVFLDPEQNYSFDWIKKPAKIKFEKRQQISKFIPNNNQQINSQLNQQVNPQELQKAALSQMEPKQEIATKPIENKQIPKMPPSLPVFNGLRLPQSTTIEKTFQNTGSEGKMPDLKASPEIIKQEETRTKEPEKNKESTSKPNSDMDLPEIKKQEKKIKSLEKKNLNSSNLEPEEKENREDIWQTGRFIRKLKKLDDMLTTNTFDQEAIEAQEAQVAKAAETKDSKKIASQSKTNPRNYVIKKNCIIGEKNIKKQEADFTTSKIHNKNMTMAEISKGFLGYAEKQGDNLVRYVNSVEGMPSDEQIKLEQYLSKILKCIETTLKITQPDFYIGKDTSKIDIKQPKIGLLLNNDGKLEESFVMVQSGIMEFDKHLLKAINRSSKGFPPIPKYLKRDKIAFSITFN